MERASAPTRSSARSAPAAWERCTGRRIRASAATSRSRCCPHRFRQDADRLRRFEQEARAAGVLNHPNITAVYDIGTHEDAPYVVQELLEGETLRTALSGGKMAQRKAIDYALQIAHGLAAAHEKGIVHRDLKPENLFVTNDGRVKILDFGLAKLTHERGQSPTRRACRRRPARTEPGVVLGTLGYMSPEQVKGKPADARSDIFSFGAILYEMLSGRRAFHGDSAAETMSAILREEPPDLSVTNQSISPGLERIVRHAIEKNPEQRFHSAHDVAFALEALSGLSVPRLEPSTAKVRGRSRSLAALAAVAVALAAGLLAGRVIWKRGPATIPSFKRLTFGRGPIYSARFASDGQTIVYSASWDGAQDPQLYSVRAESPESLRLTLPPGRVDSISGNGEMLIVNILHRSVGYARTGTLSQAPMSGSASRDLLEDVGHAAWAPDGKTIAVVRAPEWHYRLEFPAGKVLYETAGWISYPRVSPKGDMVAFLDHPLFGDDRGNVAVIDSSGKKKVLSTGWESAQGVAWSPSGEEVWFTAARAGNSRALYAVTLSGRQRPVAITPSGMLLQDISRDGRLLFVESNARLGFLGLLPGQTKERDLSGLEWSYLPILSADGKTVAFSGAGGSRRTRLLGLPAQDRRLRSRAAGRGNCAGHFPGRKVGAHLPHTLDTLADRAPPDRGRRAEDFPEGSDRACERGVRGLPPGRQAHRLRRSGAGASHARLYPGPRGRSGEAHHPGGGRGQRSFTRRRVARD